MTQTTNNVIDVTPTPMLSDAAKENAIACTTQNPALQVIDPAAFFGNTDYTEDVKAAMAQLGKISDRIGVSKDQGGFVFPDGTVTPHLDCVILAYADANIFYHRAYSDGDSNPPDCWAFGTNELTLKPSENAPDKQCTHCSACPNNQFGSAVNGKGKKCQNTKSLVVMTLDNTQQMYRLKVSPTGLAGFKTFSATVLGKTNRPLFATPVRISLKAEVKYPSLVFKYLPPSEGAYTLALAKSVMENLPKARELALKEPEIPEEDDEQDTQKAPAKNVNATRFAKQK